MYAFARGVETLVEFPAGLVGICFGGVSEACLVRVDSRKLAEFLPCPVGIVDTQLLNIAISLCDIEPSDSRVSHRNAGRQKGHCPQCRRDHLGWIQISETRILVNLT